MLVHEFMNTANIVNIFIIAKLFVQELMLVHEFMNMAKSVNTLVFDLFCKNMYNAKARHPIPSVGFIILSRDHFPDCQPDNLQIQEKRPVLDIPDILSHTSFHLPQFMCLPTASRHLRPTGDPRFHEMTHHIFGNKLGVNFRMPEHVRPGPYD
jgi:hypothetical protein